MLKLGSMCEDKGDFSEAEEFYSQAHILSCREDGRALNKQLYLHHLSRVRQELGEEEEMPELSEEHVDEIVEQLETQPAHLDLEGPFPEIHGHIAHTKSWKELDTNIQRSSSRGSTATTENGHTYSVPTIDAASDETEYMSQLDVVSSAAIEADAPCSSSHTQSYVEPEKPPPWHEPVSTASNDEVEREAFWGKDGFPQAAFLDGSAATAASSNTALNDPFDFGQGDLDNMGIVEVNAGSFSNNLDVPKDNEIVDDTWKQAKSLVEELCTSTAVMQSALPGSKQHNASVSGIDFFGFNSFHDNEMFDGTYDLPSAVEQQPGFVVGMDLLIKI